jgi:hypothetical protein
MKKHVLFGLVLLQGILLSSIAVAHEGHDHGATPQAPKGGMIRVNEVAAFEVIVKGKDIQIYPYDLKLKAHDVSKVSAKAEIRLPRKKGESLMLSPKGDHWVASFDAKGAHRYTLDLMVDIAGHKDKLSYTIEPKK